MKEQKIYMKAWLDFHNRVKPVPTDDWYLEFANNLLPVIRESYMYRGEPEEVQKQLAITMALYLEDSVAESGNWCQFTRWHERTYGRYLPFYKLTEFYYYDEINKEDIAFLIWAVNSPAGDLALPENPMDKDKLEFADVLYKKMEEVFEEAPVSDGLAGTWLMETELMEKERTVVPLASLDEKLPTNVENFLKASEGEPLMYFDSYAALKLFFVESLKWEDEEDSLLPDLREFENFVVYANMKGLLIAPDVAPYFADKRNKFYDPDAAADEAGELFFDPGLCPFDLLKYAMEHNLLPEAQFLFDNGKALLHENWDFITRWFLGEYYEGE